MLYNKKSLVLIVETLQKNQFWVTLRAKIEFGACLFMVVPGPAVRKGFVAYLTEPGRFIRLSSAASVKVANPGSATFFSAPTAPPVAGKLRRLPCKPEENSSII